MGQWNQAPSLNNRGEIAWARYDFCASPWTSQIWLFSDGESQPISPVDHHYAQTAVIADDGTVLWEYLASPTGGARIGIYRDGMASQLLPWGAIPRISPGGAITVSRTPFDWRLNPYEQVWVQRPAGFEQVTFDVRDNYMAAVNDRLEMAWTSRNVEIGADYRVHALVRMALGDLNCDGTISLEDIYPFLLALTDWPRFGAEYPACDPSLADLNSDGVVSVADIGAFVAILTR